MKVLYLSESIGLSETFITELSNGLAEKFDVTHIVSKEPQYQSGTHIEIINFEIDVNIANWLSYLFENRGKRLLYALRKKKATSKLDKWVANRDVIYVDYGTTAVRILPLVERYKKPIIVHFHGFDITSQLSSPWYQNDLKKLYEVSTYIIAASFHIKRLLILNGCPEDKIKVVRLGITIPKELIKNEVSYESRVNDFIFIGRLTPKKNPNALLHAFKLVQNIKPNALLTLIGDGPLLSECKDLIRKLDLQKNVTLMGSLPHLKTMNILKTSKIYVQHSVTSLWGDQEGFAISIAEAALFGMPVISTLHNGIPENVIDGETAYLVREFDYETMAEKMLQLINNPALAESMGKKGREHINNLCSTEKRIEQITNLIHFAVQGDNHQAI